MKNETEELCNHQGVDHLVDTKVSDTGVVYYYETRCFICNEYLGSWSNYVAN